METQAKRKDLWVFLEENSFTNYFNVLFLKMTFNPCMWFMHWMILSILKSNQISTKV